MNLKIYTFFSFITATFFSLFFLSAGTALATGAVSFPEDTTLQITVGGVTKDFTIKATSDADSLTVNTSSFAITISADQRMMITSADRLIFNSDDSTFGTDCSVAGISSVNILGSATSRTVTVTPGGSACPSLSSGGGGGGGGGGSVTTPTPTPTPTPTTTVSPTASPGLTPVPTSTGKLTPASKGFVSLAAVSLKDGDVISAAGSSDPDVYIVNPYGYKRLFLNPAIFGFYGHLGGFSKVKGATATVRDTFVTSGLFRNCETNDKKVYGVETTGEDTGALHWVNTTGEQAVADDPDFFKKVFCINTKEFSWYPRGSDYTSVSQIPDYTRKNVSSSPVSTAKKYKVVGTDFLNVRASASTAGAILGKLSAGQVIESLGQQGLWHKIKYQSKDAWVHSSYLQAI